MELNELLLNCKWDPRRVADLRRVRVEVVANGGILTTSIEALQDGTCDVKVPAEMLFPYIDAEIAKLEARILKNKQLLNQIEQLCDLAEDV